MQLINTFKKTNKMNLLIYIGWILIGLFFSWGNTSFGFTFLLIHSSIYLYQNKSKLDFSELFKNKIYITIFLFLLWAFITIIFAYNKSIAVASSIGMTILIFITLLETKLLISLKKFIYNILLPIITFGITISSSYIIYNYFTTNIRRATGVFSNVNDTGTLLLISLLFLISYFEYIDKKHKYLILLPGLLNILALLVTFSRGAFIGFIAGFAVYNLRSKKHILIFIMVFLLLFTFIYSTPKLKNRFINSLTIKDNMDRINIYMSSLKMIKTHPIKGVGPGNFAEVYPSYRWEEKSNNKNKAFAHNIFLNMAVETGIIGFILFSILIIMILIMGIKIFNGNPLHRGVVSTFIAVMVHNQFDCTILKFEVGVVFWSLVGLIIAISMSKKKSESF